MIAHGGISAYDWPAFWEEQRAFAVRRTKVGCILTLVLVPAGISLDCSAYPDKWMHILPSRILCDAVVLPVFVALFTRWGSRYINLLSAIWALAPALVIAWMIYVTEGSVSPFYAGLNLVILGTCVLFPFSLWGAARYCSAVVASYMLACLLHEGAPFRMDVFVTNVIFVAMTSIICVTACHFSHQARISDFRLRQDLSRKNESLTELDRMKTQFFANVSHELRTPLTLIVAPVEDLLQSTDPLPPIVTESLERVRYNALRLLGMINDLLDLVRFENGSNREEPGPVQLNPLLAAMVDSIRPTAQRKGLTLRCEIAEEPLWIQGQPEEIEKVALNLIGNALKFTEPGGAVTIRLGQRSQEVRLEVEDTGMGIPQSELPHLFSMFHQVDGSATRKYRGLGIGLALSRQLVEAHHGQIVVQSRVGQGSTFTVTFPRIMMPAERASHALPQVSRDIFSQVFRNADLALVSDEPANDQSRQVVQRGFEEADQETVLVVDDERSIRRHLWTVLSRDYRVLEATDGQVALEICQGTSPAVVLLDMMLPGQTGLEICRLLRAMSHLRDCKILMLTARVEESLKIDALRAGADDFLTKPFSSLELKTRVANLVQSGQLQRELRKNNEELKTTLDRLRATESQLVQSEKMNALGGLAAGLLHEINNPLNHTMMAATYSRRCLAKLLAGHGEFPQGLRTSVDEVQESLDDIEGGMKRISEIITDLRVFAHPEAVEHCQTFRLQEAIDTALRFTAATREGIDVRVEVSPDQRITASRTHVTQVLVNLLTNAADALYPVRKSRDPKIVVSSALVDDRVEIRVRDNGSGIAREYLDRVFEPFFTTKDVGQGMGLGLSVCHTIVKNHQGKLSVASEPGEWTEFRFDLPLTDSGAHDDD